MDNIIKVTGQQQERIKLPMCGKDREGNLYELPLRNPKWVREVTMRAMLDTMFTLLATFM